MVLSFLSSLGVKDLRKSVCSRVSMNREPDGSLLCWDVDSSAYHGEFRCVLRVLSVSVRELRWEGYRPAGL